MFFENFGEPGVFRQETVAGMYRIGTGDFARRHNGGDVEITVRGRWRADANALVGQAHMHGRRVSGGVNRDRLHAQLAAGAQHTKRNFTTVGYEDFFKHLNLGLMGAAVCM